VLSAIQRAVVTCREHCFAGKLVDQDYDESELAMALAGLPSVPDQS
jgi:hypothetical protein